MVAKAVLHHLPSSVKINRKSLIFFLWSIFNTLLATAAPQYTTFYCTCAGGCPHGVYGDMPFKQWAVTEFPVAEKKSVTKIQRQLKNFTASMLLTKCTDGHWSSKITGQEELSDVHCSGQPTTVTQALLQYVHEVIRNDPWITTRKLATELLVSNGSLNNISNAFIYSKVCAHWLQQSLTKYHKTV